MGRSRNSGVNCIRSGTFVITFILSTMFCFGQKSWPGPEQLAVIKSSPLFVISGGVDEDLSAKCKRAGTQDDYLEWSDEINSAVKEGVDHTKMTFHGEVEHIDYSTLESRLNDGEEVVVYLKFYVENVTQRAFGYRQPTGQQRSYLNLYYHDGEERIAASAMLPYSVPSKADIVYAMQQIERAFTTPPMDKKSRKAYKANLKGAASPSLSNMTLLIPRAELSAELDEEAVAELYPHKFKIVDKDFIDEQVLAYSDEYAYVHLLPLIAAQADAGGASISNIKYLQFIVSTKNGTMIAVNPPTTVSTPFGSSNNRISAKDLKGFVK